MDCALSTDISLCMLLYVENYRCFRVLEINSLEVQVILLENGPCTVRHRRDIVSDSDHLF